MNKEIKRDAGSVTIFNERSVEQDYATLLPLLKEGMQVLDVGCGTGAISKGIASRVGKNGRVTGIDNTDTFIKSGSEKFATVSNLNLIHADLFDFRPDQKFDLIVSARTLQWLSNPKDAILKMKSWLKPDGWLSVLDYNHDALMWQPAPPPSMQTFYHAFLSWRANAGMNNKIAADLPTLFAEAGFHSIGVLQADEVYTRGDANFSAKLGIWAKVAASTQMVTEGYLKEEVRLKAIADYNNWIEQNAQQMIMKLTEVRGKA